MTSNKEYQMFSKFFRNSFLCKSRVSKKRYHFTLLVAFHFYQNYYEWTIDYLISRFQTITCDCEATPALQLKAFRQRGDKLEVNHYRVNVNRFRARLNIVCITEKLLVDLKCDGWPEVGEQTHAISLSADFLWCNAALLPFYYDRNFSSFITEPRYTYWSDDMYTECLDLNITMFMCSFFSPWRFIRRLATHDTRISCVNLFRYPLSYI